MRQSNVAFIRAWSFILLLSGATASAAPPSNATATWGFDVAGMDRNVKPGRRLVRVRQRHLGQSTRRSPPTAPPEAASRSFATSPRRAFARADRGLQPRRRQEPRPRQGRDPLPGASWTRRRPSSPTPSRSARLAPVRAAPSKEDIARLMGQVDGRLRRQLLRPRSLRRRQAAGHLFALLAPVRPRPRRPRLLSRSQVPARRSIATGNMSRRCSASPAGPIPRRAADEGRRDGDQARRGALDPRREPRPRQDLQSDDPRRSRSARRRASRGQAFCDRRRPLGAERGDRRPEHRLPEDRRRSSPTPPSTRSRPGRRSTPPTRPRPCSRSASSTRSSSSASHFLNGQPQQRDRWKRGVAFAEAAMGEAIGRDLRRRSISRRVEGEDGPAGREPSRPRSAAASATSPG